LEERVKQLEALVAKLSSAVQIDESGKVTLRTKGDLELASEGSVTVSSSGLNLASKSGIVLDATKDIQVKAGNNIDVTSSRNLALAADMNASMTGLNVKIDGEINVESKAGAQNKMTGVITSVEAAAMNTSRGALIMIGNGEPVMIERKSFTELWITANQTAQLAKELQEKLK
jgi:hypothetical protein